MSDIKSAITTKLCFSYIALRFEQMSKLLNNLMSISPELEYLEIKLWTKKTAEDWRLIPGYVKELKEDAKMIENLKYSSIEIK